ncbi:hypothetical protein ONS96_001745 [Cadophora gregata f. sp. sojae]|nr:hypothetical protein ONS96_001745 [Cadophora gregata f. sp. sojae]
MPVLPSLLVREVHGVLAKRAVDHTVIEGVVVIMVCVFVLGGGIYWLRKKYD